MAHEELQHSQREACREPPGRCSQYLTAHRSEGKGNYWDGEPMSRSQSFEQKNMFVFFTLIFGFLALCPLPTLFFYFEMDVGAFWTPSYFVSIISNSYLFPVFIALLRGVGPLKSELFFKL